MAKTSTLRAASAPVIIADAKAKAIALPASFQIKGRNALLRNTAMAGVATCAYVESKSRGDTISQIKIAAGKAPTAVELDAIALEYIVGRVAQRLPFDGAVTIPDRLAKARSLILQHAAPAKDGVKAAGLRKHQVGRRTVDQHKAIRAAESAWSMIKAEAGYSVAITLADKNKKAANKRGASVPGGNPAKGAAPTHSQLVAAPATALTYDDAVQHLMTQAASLLGYANKNAQVIPTDFGIAVRAFSTACIAAGKAHDLRSTAKA